MYIVTETNNYIEEGTAFRFDTKEDGIEKLKEMYKDYMRMAVTLDRENTYINETFTYAQVSDGLLVNEFRLMAC